MLNRHVTNEEYKVLLTWIVRSNHYTDILVNDLFDYIYSTGIDMSAYKDIGDIIEVDFTLHSAYINYQGNPLPVVFAYCLKDASIIILSINNEHPSVNLARYVTVKHSLELSDYPLMSQEEEEAFIKHLEELDRLSKDW